MSDAELYTSYLWLVNWFKSDLWLLGVGQSFMGLFSKCIPISFSITFLSYIRLLLMVNINAVFTLAHGRLIKMGIVVHYFIIY